MFTYLDTLKISGNASYRFKNPVALRPKSLIRACELSCVGDPLCVNSGDLTSNVFDFVCHRILFRKLCFS